MKTGIKVYLFWGVLAGAVAASGYVPATFHHAFSDMADADGNGVADSLEQYLLGSGVSLPATYDPYASDLDGDGTDDYAEWVLGLDPLVPTVSTNGSSSFVASGTGVTMRIVLPDWFGGYAEIFGRESLTEGNWGLVEDWIPTYGAQSLEFNITTESNTAFFVMGFDATLDYDSDGYSDWMEHYVTGTDDETFDYVDSDGDGMHDWWELKLFGSLDEDLLGDFDGDGLANGTELVWYPDNRIVMYSDPSLYDTDGDQRNDGLEVTNLKTDPLNPDISPPAVSLVVSGN